MRKADPSSQSGTAGFDYYLQELEKKREGAGLVIQLDLLRLLADRGGKTGLYELFSDYLHGQVTGDDFLELTDKIKRMQEAGLVVIIGRRGGEGDIDDLSVKLTDVGKRTLEVQGSRSA